MNYKIYESHFSKEQLDNLKASELRDLDSEETVLTVTVVLMFLSIFVSFILLVALLLWFSKTTIFFFTIAATPIIFLTVTYVKLVKKFKNTIKKYKSRIESRQTESPTISG